MLSYFFRQLFNSFGIFFRTIRAFFTRKLVGMTARLRRMTNFSRKATKVAADSFQGAAAAMKKPTRREDFVETKRLFISKSFLISLAVGLVVLGCLVYFVVWPFLLSRFFTARFYQGEAKLDTWSGRVVVYYDQDRKQPMYAGRLEDGLLQGQGTQYGENGLVIYQGSFVDGVASGQGKAYEDGVLVYEGSFSAGLPNGQGTAYADGAKAYAGAFLDGEPSGEGTAYYAGGGVRYAGDFSGGLPNGQGTAYYESGVRSYTGGFVDGLREGTGSAFREDGTLCYQGSFAQGEYSGEGTCYLENDLGFIQANFEAGRTDGAIRWYRNGALWYDGAADDLTPDGYGTLYAKSGAVVYAGELDRGTLDGAWLLSLTVPELREAFGGASLTESDYAGGGFLLVNRELGLWALCSYRQEGQEAAVYGLWFAPGEGEDTMSALLPFGSLDAFGQWAEGLDQAGELDAFISAATLPPELDSGGTWHQARCAGSGWSCTALAEEEDGAPALLRWQRVGEMPATSVPVIGDGQPESQQRLDQLLESLEQPAAGGGTAASGDAARLVGLMLTWEEADALVGDLLTVWENQQAIQALEENRGMLRQLLEEEALLISRGSGDQARADALQSRIDALDLTLTQCRVRQEQAALSASASAGVDVADSDLSGLVCLFDPASLDVSALYRAVEDQAPAGQAEQDAALLEAKECLLALEEAYQTAQAARAAREQASAAAQTAAEGYARGTADKAGLYDARCAQNQAGADLCAALAGFTRQANALNTLTGGELAQQSGWLADTFAVLAQSQPADTAAPAASEAPGESGEE